MNIYIYIYICPLGTYLSAQLINTNAFSANKFCLNVLSTSTAIYSQSIVNINRYSTDFYQRKTNMSKMVLDLSGSDQ